MSRELKAVVREVEWPDSSEKTVAVTVLVLAADLEQCPAPLPDHVTLVVSEPILGSVSHTRR